MHCVLIAIKTQDSYNLILIGLFKSTLMNKGSSSLESRTNLNSHNDSERKLIYEEDLSEYDLFLKEQENLKNNLAFWNSMAQSKLETISSCINLFVLLLIITLGGHLYNGPNTNGPEVLGWIMVAQVCFFYVLVLMVKFLYIPSIERQLQQWASQGIKLYKSIQQEKKQIKNLDLMELELLQETVTGKADRLRKCFPSANTDIVLNEINATLSSRSTVPYRRNNELRQVQIRQKNAKYWQALWQTFVLGKTFTIPGVLLLVFIITPLSIATAALTSNETRNGQGWAAVAFWAAGIFVFILIKFVFWNYLNRKVENARSDAFVAYYPISLKHKQIKNLNLQQLENLEHILIIRPNEFQKCFSQNSSEVLGRVRSVLKQRLPNKKSDDEESLIIQIIQQQKSIQSYTTAWTNFFNLRLVVTIINALKFLIVMAITFVEYYPSDANALQSAQRVVGSVGVAVFGLGYLFYFFLRAIYLPYLDGRILQFKSSPFTTFRLVYFGNKKLQDLQVHQLEDVYDGLSKRRAEFLNCFPNINPETLDRDINSVINQKTAPYKGAERAYHLLKLEAEGKKRLSFWTSFVDGALMSSMYSVYVLLVLLIVSLTKTYENSVDPSVSVNQVMGWIGVANIGALMLIVLFFKTFLLEYMGNNVKSLRIEGYSQFNLVYAKTKQLTAVQLADLNKIEIVIQTNPIQFRRCFPNAELISTLKSVKQAILLKKHQKATARVRNAEEQVQYQTLTLELSRSTVALASWTSLVKDKLFLITPLAIVIYILWGQCIATTLYGVTVCGFLTVANLSIIALILLFYNLFYRGYLQNKINVCKFRLKALQTRDAAQFII